MMKKNLKKIEKNRTSIHLKYGSDFTDIQTNLFEKMRNCYGISKKILRMVEFVAVVFNYDVEKVSFENLYSAVDFYLSHGGVLSMADIYGQASASAPVSPAGTRTQTIEETQEPEEEPVGESGLRELEMNSPAESIDISKISKDELTQMLSD